MPQMSPENSRRFSLPPAFQWVALGVVVFVSRLPFLSAGYGMNSDAWRVANTARHIAETGQYEVSRFPGNPIHEIACAFLWRGGPVALNGASALFSVLAALMFARLARQAGCKDWLPATLAFAFLPLVYICSVTSKDCIWSLAFTLAALTLVSRPVAAGVALGLAIGCRITAGTAALPLTLLLLVSGDPATRLRRFVQFAGCAAVTAIASFLPVFLRYGTGFFTCYTVDHSNLRTILIRATQEVWGWPGIAGILIAACAAAFSLLRRPRVGFKALVSPYSAAWIAGLLATLPVFIALPHQAAYLLPVTPFVILFLARHSPRPAFLAFCGLAIASSFIEFGQTGPRAGAILEDHRERVALGESLKRYLTITENLPGKNIFVLGEMQPKVLNLTADSPHPNIQYAYLLGVQDIIAAHRQGATIWVTPIIRNANFQTNGIDLAKYGARNFLAEHGREMQAPAGRP